MFVNVMLVPNKKYVFVVLGIPSSDSREEPNAVKQMLVSAFKNKLVENLKAEVEETGPCGCEELEVKQSARWTTTWWQQFSVLLRRGMKERKHESFSVLKIGQVLVVALLSGLLWWQSDVSHLQDQVRNFRYSF